VRLHKVIWRDIFGRTMTTPGADNTCVFVVTDQATGEQVCVDLWAVSAT